MQLCRIISKTQRKITFMKLNAVRAMLIVSLIIILVYILGLFLPIIKNSKDSKIKDLHKTEYII